MKKIQRTLAVLFVFTSTLLFAQEKPMYEVYGAMVYNFTKYVQWPDHADGGEFVIGIVGGVPSFEGVARFSVGGMLFYLLSIAQGDESTGLVMTLTVFRSSLLFTHYG